MWKQRVKTQIGKLKGSEISETNPLINEITVKLPKLNIKSFFGDFESWLEFCGHFEFAIDKTPGFMIIDKLN